MATKIPIIDDVCNCVVGCTETGPGCANCYARELAGTRLAHLPDYAGLTRRDEHGRLHWTGEVRCLPERVEAVLRTRKPRSVGWAFTGDLFHPAVPDAFIDRCFAVMALTPHLKHVLLTKRAARMREYLSTAGRADAIACASFAVMPAPSRHTARRLSCWPLPNVFAGVSVSGPADLYRVEDLLATPAASRWVSWEPCIENIDWAPWLGGPGWRIGAAVNGLAMGAESGPRRRLAKCEACGGKGQWVMLTDTTLLQRSDGKIHSCTACSGTGYAAWAWARQARDACQAAGVAYALKQLPDASGRIVHAPALDGRQWLDLVWE